MQCAVKAVEGLAACHCHAWDSVVSEHELISLRMKAMKARVTIEYDIPDGAKREAEEQRWRKSLMVLGLPATVNVKLIDPYAEPAATFPSVVRSYPRPG